MTSTSKVWEELDDDWDPSPCCYSWSGEEEQEASPPPWPGGDGRGSPAETETGYGNVRGAWTGDTCRTRAICPGSGF